MNTAALLVVLVCCSFLFAFAFLRIVELAAETKREADALRAYLESHGQPEESSLMDDSPAPLPDRWETSGGHVVEFKGKRRG